MKHSMLLDEGDRYLEELGATQEGRIREPSFGKVAAIRTPDGHLVSLLQPAAINATTH